MNKILQYTDEQPFINTVITRISKYVPNQMGKFEQI